MDSADPPKKPTKYVFCFHCKACPYTDHVFERARNHVLAKHDQAPRQRCPVNGCKANLHHRSDRRAHLLQHNAEDRLVACLFCHQQSKPTFKIDFTNTTAMRWHLTEAHAMVKSASRLHRAFPHLSYVSNEAELSLVDFGKWYRVVGVADNQAADYDFTHVTRRHSSMPISAECRLCLYRVPNIQTNLDRVGNHFHYHISMLYESRPYVCCFGSKLNWCQAAYKLRAHLHEHTKNAHALRAKRFSGLIIDRCIICSKAQNSFEEFMHHLHVSHNLKAIRNVQDLHYLNGIYRADRENPGLMFPFWRLNLSYLEKEKNADAEVTTPINEAAIPATSNTTTGVPAFVYVDECRQVIRKIQSKQQPVYWSRVVKKTYRRYVRHQQAAGKESWREQHKFEKKLEKRMQACAKMTLKPATVVKLVDPPPPEELPST